MSNFYGQIIPKFSSLTYIEINDNIKKRVFIFYYSP